MVLAAQVRLELTVGDLVVILGKQQEHGFDLGLAQGIDADTAGLEHAFADGGRGQGFGDGAHVASSIRNTVSAAWAGSACGTPAVSARGGWAAGAASLTGSPWASPT